MLHGQKENARKPMCDMSIQDGALEPEAECKLVARVSDLLVEHEVRRIVDLVEDPAAAQASIRRNSTTSSFPPCGS